MKKTTIFLAAVAFLAAASIARPLNDDAQCYSGYPKQYTTYKLQASEGPITIDGKLDEPAWQTAPILTPLKDIEGNATTKTVYLNTTVRMRWDSEYLYFGAILEEPQAWATINYHNGLLYTENNIEFFADPSGNNQYYKELEFNAHNMNWNLMITKPPLDGGISICNVSDPSICQYLDQNNETYEIDNMGMKTAVTVDGTLNDPSKGSNSWTFEAKFPLKGLAKYHTCAIPPNHGDFWHMNVMRVEWHLHTEKLEDGTLIYVKDAGKKCHNWAWQPTGVINIHLPDRWGYLRFADEAVPSTPVDDVRDDSYPVRKALQEMFYSEKIYKSVYGRGYTESVQSLVVNARLPEYIARGDCTGVPVVSIDDDGNFLIKVTSLDGSIAGTIDTDRKVTIYRY